MRYARAVRSRWRYPETYNAYPTAAAVRSAGRPARGVRAHGTGHRAGPIAINILPQFSELNNLRVPVVFADLLRASAPHATLTTRARTYENTLTKKHCTPTYTHTNYNKIILARSHTCTACTRTLSRNPRPNAAAAVQAQGGGAGVSSPRGYESNDPT